MVTIRTANIDDAEMLTALGRQTFHDTFAAYNTPADMDAYMRQQMTVERFAAGIARPGSVWLLAQTPAKVIGFAALAPEPVPACITTPAPVRLNKLYVSAESIGSGVGAALMRANIAWARNAGHGSIWLGVWERNHRAKAFYERWGFVEVGAEVFRLGDDDQKDLLMQCALDA